MISLKKCTISMTGTLFMMNCMIQPAVFASSFEALGKPIFLYMDTKSVNLNGDGERISFVMQRDGVLRMYSRDGMHDYLSFTGYYGDNIGIGYSIVKLEMKNPKKTFFIINADQGAHAKNAGFWIVGKYKGQWTTFVSLDSLANAGYTVGEWHRLSTSTGTFGGDTLYIKSVHEYMPEGAQYGYQLKLAEDFSAALQWDDQAQWFSIARIR